MITTQHVLRSNYFAVRDADAFQAWIAEFPSVTVAIRTLWDDVHGAVVKGFAVLSVAGLPTEGFPPNVPARRVDFLQELATHLAPGWVVELRENGPEEFQTLRGRAGLVTAAGAQEQFPLEDLHPRQHHSGDPFADSTS